MRFLAACIGFCLYTPGAVNAGDIHAAAQAGDVSRVIELLEAGADVNEDSAFGSALHFAAMRGHVDVVRALLDRGADANFSSASLGAPLHLAAKEGNLELVTLLLGAGADPNARDKNEFTPLHYSAFDGNADIVATLLSAGADAKARAVGPGTAFFEYGLFEPLQLSEKHGHSDVSALLRAAGGGPLPIEPVSDLIANANPKRGLELASVRCLKCHVLEDNEGAFGGSAGYAGPPIPGIFGSKVATFDGYDYSSALKSFGGQWTEDRLYAWILHPMLTVPGATMPEVKGTTAEDVADIVAYFKQAFN